MKCSSTAQALNLYNFKQKSVYCTFTFDVVGSGDTTVDLDVEVLTGTMADSYEYFLTVRMLISHISISMAAKRQTALYLLLRQFSFRAKSQQQLLSPQQQHSLQL